MSVMQWCNPNVVVAARGTSLTEASRLMREHHVGSLIVVDEHNPRIPVGILTDRDVVVEVLAAGLDHRNVSVGDIMGTSLATVHEDTDELTALKAMRLRGVRRMPVVDKAGELRGMLTLDDLLEVMAGALLDVAGTVGSEQTVERWRRR